jgi:hypothetical protein
MARNELPLPEPPPEVVEILDFPAETTPPLRDRPRFRVPKGISERRDVAVQAERAPLSTAAGRRLAEAASASPAVKRVLGRRSVTIGGHRLTSKEGRRSVVVFYSYANQWTVEARLAERAEEWSVEVLRVQPPLTDDESEIAVGLARRALEGDLDGLEAGSIAIMREDPADPLSGRRMADVRFFAADERLPRYYAIVDLADRAIVQAGSAAGEADHG